MKKFLGLTPDFDLKEEIILRDFLALERTRLANERTLLSYIRASLYLVLGGVGILQLNEFKNIRPLGYIALVLSGIFIVVGVIRFIHLNKVLSKYYEKEEVKESSD